MKRRVISAITVLLMGAVLSFAKPRDGSYSLHFYTTSDVHGHYFDVIYGQNNVYQASLLSVMKYVNERRTEFGPDNVILLDGGDFLQGDNAAFYYNYVAVDKPHIYPLIASYMKYDAVAVGNHDIETGPTVYNRVKDQMKVPFLAANVLDPKTGNSHFRPYTIVYRHGLKIAVIGFTNANIRAWLDEDKLGGLDFHGLMADSFAQNVVDKVRSAEKPDLVVVLTHTGTGPGDGSQLESEGRDLLRSLHDVDIIVCSHDHRPYFEKKDDICLVNSGSHGRTVGHVAVDLNVKRGRVVSKKCTPETVFLKRNEIDETMKEHFAPQLDEVVSFSTREIGTLQKTLYTRDGFCGMSDCVNLVHTVCLTSVPSDISFAAPLSYNGTINAGKLIFNDLFTLYPYENKLYVVPLTGEEIRRYLEVSYDDWINTVDYPDTYEPLLKISRHPDSRTESDRWSFDARSYNFDSAGGINYTVDITKPFGSRIEITSMANGSAFKADSTYRVAMTSYRASGGGNLLKRAGIEDAESRIILRDREIREIIYEFILEHKEITPEFVGNTSLIGTWSFQPASIAQPLLERDMIRLFQKR